MPVFHSQLIPIFRAVQLLKQFLVQVNLFSPTLQPLAVELQLSMCRAFSPYKNMYKNE